MRVSAAGAAAGADEEAGGTSRRRLALPLAAVAVITASAGMSFQRVFGPAPLAPVVAVAAVAPSVLAALWSARRRRLPLWAAIAASLGCWLVIADATLLRPTERAGFVPTAETARTIVTAISDSWWQMLTTILPVPGSPRLLLAVQLLVWLGGLAAAEAVARSAATLAAALPAAVVLTAGLALGVDGQGSVLAPAAGTVAGAALLLVSRQAEGAGARQWWLQGAGLPAAAAVSLAAALIGPRLPLAGARAPFDPRRYVHPVVDVQSPASPLDYVSRWLAEPSVPLFSVRAASAQDWRLAVLDSYDGVTWAEPGRLENTGGRVPVPGPASGTGVALVQTFIIERLGGAWLPAADRPALVTGVPADTDPATGVLVDRAALAPGVRYQVISHKGAPGTAALRRATPASSPAARADLALPPGLPAIIPDTAQAATAGAGFPFQQAEMLASYLLDHERYLPTAPPGHTYGAIAYFLATSHRGTPEQFATAYALMARSLGLPSRIVVGFRPGRPAGRGIWQVDAGDALVWPEVDFRGAGWVAFYPTPATSGGALAAPAPAGETASQRQVDQQIASQGQTPVSSPRARRPAAPPRGPAGGRRTAAITTALSAAIAAGGVAGCAGWIVLVPWRRRRRRRRAADPGARVIGAWQEAVDRLRACGPGLTAAQSAPEIAEFGVSRIGAVAEPDLRALAVLADGTGFGRPPVTEAAARAAWQHLARVERAVRQATTRRARLSARLRPRPRPLRG